jgi:hypothetical protein
MAYQLIYSSQAITAMDLAELEKILAQARANNEARNVTGALIYMDEVFIQILEGDKDTVRELIRTIAADPRHTGIKVFYELELDERMFAGWRMAYVGATAAELGRWAGLAGAQSLETIVEELGRKPERCSQFAAGMLRRLAE